MQSLNSTIKVKEELCCDDEPEFLIIPEVVEWGVLECSVLHEDTAHVTRHVAAQVLEEVVGSNDFHNISQGIID